MVVIHCRCSSWNICIVNKLMSHHTTKKKGRINMVVFAAEVIVGFVGAYIEALKLYDLCDLK